MKKLLTFTASWCGPCKMLKPILQQLHDDGLIVWDNYDIDENKNLATQMAVKSVPTLMFFDGNTITHLGTGFMPKEKILQLYALNAEAAPVDDFIIEDVVASEDDEAFVFSDEDFASLPDADEANESHPDLDGAANGFVDVAQTTLKPKAVTDAENLILSFDFEEEPVLFDDEFSSEDLGNDTPDDVINPDDLF